MTEPKPGQPWAYIGHKDNHWAGIIDARSPRERLQKFLGDFAANGFAIVTVYGRDEYDTVLGGMKSWRKHPEYQSKKKAAQ